jgi:heptosyltransferase-3
MSDVGPENPRARSDSLLVVRPGAIGDALLACPSLAALRSAHPDSPLVVMAHPAVAQLVLEEGLADRFYSRDGPESDALFAQSPSLARERLGAIRAAVAWSSDSDGRLAANLAALGAQPLVIASARPREDVGRHVAQHLLDTLAPLGVRGSVESWTGFRRAASPSAPSELLPNGAGALVVLHPGSGSRRKNWPAERFAALGARLREQSSARLIVLAGQADESVLEAFAKKATFPYSVLLDRPLIELAAVLAACDLYVGNDSGISHLAGLCRAPTVAVFGPTDPLLWRPLGRWVRVVRGCPLESLAEEVVAAAALDLLSATQGRSRSAIRRPSP